MKQNRRRKFVLGLDLNIVVTRIRIIKDRIIQENTMLTVWLAWWLYSGVEDADTQTPDQVCVWCQRKTYHQSRQCLPHNTDSQRLIYTTSSLGINTKIVNMPRRCSADIDILSRRRWDGLFIFIPALSLRVRLLMLLCCLTSIWIDIETFAWFALKL